MSKLQETTTNTILTTKYVTLVKTDGESMEDFIKREHKQFDAIRKERRDIERKRRHLNLETKKIEAQERRLKNKSNYLNKPHV